MRRQLLTSILVLAVMTLLTGGLYPFVVTATAQVAFEREADGSLVEVDGEPIGSALLGQPFEGDEWFHPRPSAAGDGYDGRASSGTNLGPLNDDLAVAVAERAAVYREENGLADEVPVPVDAITSSASGLDPHISVSNARLQAPRVATARGLDLARVQELVGEATHDRPLGVLGDPGVNVLELNIAVARLASVSDSGRE